MQAVQAAEQVEREREAREELQEWQANPERRGYARPVVAGGQWVKVYNLVAEPG